jgi:ATP-binding cassette subfamily F protein 3
MLTVSGLEMSFGGRTLFSGASFQINRGDRIALVGPNGAGKSTLFLLLLGREQPDAGQVSLERGATLGWLPQESAPAGEETVLQLACSITPHHTELFHQLAQHPLGDPGGDGIQAELLALGLPSLEAKAKRILAGLAFREADFHRPAREMSGGWIMRAHLARLLVMEPDLLLLDEPTNHLDLESLGWFQNYLRTYRGAILLISHDREFLNSLAGGILELRGGHLHRYRGNYDTYLEEKAAREAQHLAAYKNQQKEIETLQRFADRFRAKASKASQAQSKLKQIERMEKIEAPESSERTVHIQFPRPPRCGQFPLRLHEIDFAYGSLTVYRGMEFECERGDRIALVGPNGAGKSTLLKLLAGVLTPQAGRRLTGHQTKTGYFSQNRLDILKPERTVIEEALALENPAPEQLTRTILGSFLFPGDAIYKRVSVLSGGEKSRLGLVKLLLDPPNVLLLDEPTTHLDMASIEALIRALQTFEGTIVFISHDVYFIRALATRVLRISAGQLQWFAGGYDYYLEKSGLTSSRAALVDGEQLSDHRPESSPAPAVARPSTFKTKDQKRAEAQARQAKNQVRREAENKVSTLEKEIARLEAEQKSLVEKLEDPTTYEQGGDVMDLNRQLLGLSESLERHQEEWFQAQQELESLKS